MPVQGDCQKLTNQSGKYAFIPHPSTSSSLVFGGCCNTLLSSFPQSFENTRNHDECLTACSHVRIGDLSVISAYIHGGNIHTMADFDVTSLDAESVRDVETGSCTPVKSFSIRSSRNPWPTI